MKPLLSVKKKLQDPQNHQHEPNFLIAEDKQFIQYQHHFLLQQKKVIKEVPEEAIKILYYSNEEKPYLEPLILKELISYQIHQLS
jgi:hypothetical protein